MPQSGLLRIHGHGNIEVELLTTYLLDLKRAYDSILIFELAIDRLRRTARELHYPPYPLLLDFLWPTASRRLSQPIRDWPPTPEQIAALVPASEQLMLSGVRLASPGFWDFLGNWNPLEVLRQYLNDRHERRKDRDYRESAEKRRLSLENLLLENRVMSERIKLAKELGATDRDLSPLINSLVGRPLSALDQHQNRGLIEHAEIAKPPTDTGSQR